MKKNILMILLMFVFNSVNALEVPHSTKFDERIKIIDYNSKEVIKLIAHYGFSVHVMFSKSEIIKNIALGDKLAWDIGTTANHLFIKPTAVEANTNMTIITNKRVYNFDLYAHSSKMKSFSNDMQFQIAFNYPKEKAQKLALIKKQKNLEDKLKKIESTETINWNYWAKGHKDIRPIRVYDNKKFTFLTFSGNRDMPAIYIVNEDGSESLVNTSIDPTKKNTIIVHKIARKMILRNSEIVVCIKNKSYDTIGIVNKTGTISNTIKRTIKGAK